MFEAAHLLHIPHRKPFHCVILRPPTHDIHEYVARGVGTDGVDDGKREFAFSEIFCQALFGRILRVDEIHVVVSYLKYYADEVDEWKTVSVPY